MVDETMTILGGNMRYLALKKAGEKAATAKIVTGLTKEQKREFVIKDNSNFGEYDFDALANGWSDLPLADWGVDLPEDWLGGDKSEPADAEPQMAVDQGSMEKGERRHNAILNAEIVQKIRSEYSFRKVTHKSLAIKYGVTRGSIQAMLSGRTWGHIKEVLCQD